MLRALSKDNLNIENWNQFCVCDCDCPELSWHQANNWAYDRKGDVTKLESDFKSKLDFCGVIQVIWASLIVNMQHCAENVSRTSIHHTSILLAILHCVQIILCAIPLICVVNCAKTFNLMYTSYMKHLSTTKYQMNGHLRGGIFRGVLKFKKHLNNSNNNRWHFNRILTGATMTRNMCDTFVTMSGKFENKFSPPPSNTSKTKQSKSKQCKGKRWTEQIFNRNFE